MSNFYNQDETNFTGVRTACKSEHNRLLSQEIKAPKQLPNHHKTLTFFPTCISEGFTTTHGQHMVFDL